MTGMRRHTPTLYTHPENDADDEEEGTWPAPNSRHPYTPPSTIHTSGSKSRSKLRQRSSYSPAPGQFPSNNQAADSPPHNAYSHIYNQFIRRYRSGPVGVEDDFRNDPDANYYNRGLGQLVDGGSDDEDIRGGSLSGVDPQDRVSALILDTEHIEPQSVEDRERLEWQTMLASVLAGEVLKAENNRIAGALKSSMEEENSVRANLWIELRAKIHGRSAHDERKRLEERRLRTAENIISEILAFKVSDPSPGSEIAPADHALKQVNALILRLDVAYTLYPSMRSFSIDNPRASEKDFQRRCDTLITWSTVITSLRQQSAMLRKWTGSETLDVTQPTSTPPTPFPASHPPVENGGGNGTAFVERLLKEEAIQRQFEKGSMTTIGALVGTTRDAHVNLAHMFREMNLPSFENELVPLVSFLTDLAQAVLRVRLDYAQKLKNPDLLIIDQMAEDLKVKIGFACTLKRQYEAFLYPDPDGNWNLPPCISRDYDSVILEALTFFFKLIHWKLKSGTRVHFKETDVIEAQWATFSDVSLTISGGASLVAEQLW